jgi:hypothetical protein
MCEQQTSGTGNPAALLRRSYVNSGEAFVYAGRNQAERAFEQIIAIVLSADKLRDSIYESVHFNRRRH